MERGILIRNMDASFLYWQIKNDKKIQEYEEKRKKLAEAKKNKDDKSIKKLNKELEPLSHEVFSFKDKDGKNKNIKLDWKDNRYRYTGTLADSLMSRKLRQVAKDRGDEKAIRDIGDSQYTDLIINLKFKNDIRIPDDTPRETIDKDTREIKEDTKKRMKRFITRKKLREMAYRDGITINGIHYVNFQRSSSKARTGNVLFIDDRYFDEMEQWQNMDIPFRHIVRSEDRKNPNPFEETDLVSTRSYSSLTSSAIIGTLNIDPYSILLIDDVAGKGEMECNVVRNVSEDGKSHLVIEEENYEQSTDLWDGQSLLDESVFATSYKNKGFLLLRNHFLKSAAFNTKLQDYFREHFSDCDESEKIVKDRFGNEFLAKDILMVTTKNSCKIFKFADIVCEYMILNDEKAKLRELEKNLKDLIDKQRKYKQAVINAKRNLTVKEKELCEGKATLPNVQQAKNNLRDAINIENENCVTLDVEIKERRKEIKFEQERLTWNWYRRYLKEHEEVFGVCKYEKSSKFGDFQQLWYQILVSLDLSKDDLWEIVRPQIEEVNLMKKHVAFFKHGIAMRTDENTNNSIMLRLLEINDDISRTQWYKNYRRSQIQMILNRLYEGKVQIPNSDFCVLFGNPYEMLRASCGDKIESSIMDNWECYCKRYGNEELYGFRSPHICQGNCAVLQNKYHDEYKWFNLTDNIICVNFWNQGAFLSPRWNGCDTDADTAYIGNFPLILEKTKESSNQLIPINGLEPEAKLMEYTNENMAKVDGQLCNDSIGKICNYARDLQCFYWHLKRNGLPEKQEKYLQMIYDDLCILEVLSNIAIDSAKRRYGVNIASELKEIKNRPYIVEEGAIIHDTAILFEHQRYKNSFSKNDIEEYRGLCEKKEKSHDPEEIEQYNKDIDKLLKAVDKLYIRPKWTGNVKSKSKQRRTKICNSEEMKAQQAAYREEQKILKEKIYHKLENPMDLLAEIIGEKVVRCDNTKTLPIIEILDRNKTKGQKADYHRVNEIKKICLKWKGKLDKVQNDFDAKKISFDEMYDEKQKIQAEIIQDIKYMDHTRTKQRSITVKDIQKLICMAYDEHPKKDKHGKIVYDEDGKKVIDDKRDIKIKKFGANFLQWVYMAFPDVFLSAIKQNKGKCSYIKKIESMTSDTSKVTEVKSFKDLPLLLPDEVYELYGEKYIIAN